MFAQGWNVERVDVGLLDVVAKGVEKLGGALDRGDTVGMRWTGAVALIGSPADAHPTWVRADFVGERPSRWRCAVRIAYAGPGDGVQHRCGVTDRAGQHVLVGGRPPKFAEVRTEGRAGPRGLEPDEPAVRGGDANGTPHVVAMGNRNHARRDCRGGSAAGTAG